MPDIISKKELEGKALQSNNFRLHSSAMGEPDSFYNQIEIDALVYLDGKMEELSLSEYITSLTIYRIYNSAVFPVVGLNLSVPWKVQHLFSAQYDTLKFRLNMWQFKLREIDGVLKITSTPEHIYQNIILVPNNYDRTHFQNESEPSMTGFTDHMRVPLELELFRMDHLLLTKPVFHGILENVNYEDLIMYILKDSPTRIAMNVPHRKTIEPQIILPSKNAIQTLKYLQRVYGIYKNGLRLFFDLDRAYCLSGNFDYDDPVGDKPPVELLTTIVYLGKVMDGAMVGGWKDYEDEINYILAPDSTIIQFNDSAPSYIYGERMVTRRMNQVDEHLNEDMKFNDYDAGQLTPNKIKNQLPAKNLKLSPSNSTLSKQENTYKIQENDTVYSIASRFNLTVAELMSTNNISNEDGLYEGQILVLPQDQNTDLNSNVKERLYNFEHRPDYSHIYNITYGVANEPKHKYYYNRSSNDFLEEETMNEITNQWLYYTLSLTNVDYRDFTINKKIYLKFIDEDNKVYNGVYIPLGTEVVYEHFTPDIYQTKAVIKMFRVDDSDIDVSESPNRFNQSIS